METLLDPAPLQEASSATPRQRRFLSTLTKPADMFANLTPNWFASIMGTGIVATSAATLPVQFPGLRTGATVVWAFASILLVLLIAATVVHWIKHRQRAMSHHNNPVMAHFYGAPAMALLTIGAGTLLLGKDVLGESLAVHIDLVLWSAGTVMGLVTAAAVPYLLFTRHETTAASAFGGWLMPIVPPMVSASTGALLIPHIPAGELRETFLMACYAMFGITLIAAAIIITLIWSRLATHKIGALAAVPTLWIVLGPLGQSVTAANLLGGNAHLAVPDPLASTLEMFGILYGVPVMGFALIWGAVVIAITVHAARQGLPFTLTWWSFIFPVGTVVTGLTGLSVHTHLSVFTVSAVVLFVLLVLAWILVTIKTIQGSLFSGKLFL